MHWGEVVGHANFVDVAPLTLRYHDIIHIYRKRKRELDEEPHSSTILLFITLENIGNSQIVLLKSKLIVSYLLKEAGSVRSTQIKNVACRCSLLKNTDTLLCRR